MRAAKQSRNVARLGLGVAVLVAVSLLVNVREPAETMSSAAKEDATRFQILPLDMPPPAPPPAPRTTTTTAQRQPEMALGGARDTATQAPRRIGKLGKFKHFASLITEQPTLNELDAVVPEWLRVGDMLVPNNSSQWISRNIRPMTRLTNLTLSWPYGQLCNQLLALSAGVARAMKHGATLYLYGPWTTLVEDLLDVSALMRADVRLSKDGAAPPNTPTFNAYLAVWCGSRATVNAVRDVVRPSKAIQAVASAQIQALRSAAPTVISVHLRDMDGLCATIAGLRPCHRKALYDADWHTVDLPDEVCRYRMSPKLFTRLADEWPTVNWTLDPLAFYLSSDGHVKENEATFFNASLVPANVKKALLGQFPRGVVNESRRIEAYMLSDMWASAQASYYLANPMSSCDSIVAQWRSEFLPFSLMETRQSPRSCFDAFRVHPEPERDVCDIIKRLALDNLAELRPCERILALGSALLKARRTGYSLVLTGAWKTFVQTELDVAWLTRHSNVDLEFVHVRPKTRYNVVYPERWRAVALNSTREYLCARGKWIDVIARAVRPKACASLSPLLAAAQSRHAAASSTGHCYDAPALHADNINALCAAALAPDDPMVSLSDPCGQVVAHWRHGAIKPAGCAAALDAEDGVMDISQGRYVCGGAEPDKDPVKRTAQEAHKPAPVDIL